MTMTKPTYVLSKSSVVSILLFLVVISSVFTEKGFALGGMPGPELDFLQRMQGDWQRHCYPSVDGDSRIYRRDFLTVDYIYLSFKTKVYADNACSKLRVEYSGRTRFVLTGGYRKYRGKNKLFALNAELKPPLPLIFSFPSLNIVAIEPGLLLFGRDFSGESERGERLTRLDTTAPFIRH